MKQRERVGHELIIVQKRIDEIHPYERNPRHNDDAVKYVKKSIERFGFKVPIVIDRDGTIVAGHTRYKASLELGLETVPCVVADDLTDRQIKAFRLADNKTAEKSSWDFNILGEELGDLFDFDMSEFGFDVDVVSPDEFGTDFGLPDDDEKNICQMTFTFSKEQADAVKSAMDSIDVSKVETFGNTNRNGNALYGVVMEWAELRK